MVRPVQGGILASRERAPAACYAAEVTLPPLLARWLAWFEISPVPALLVALAVVLVGLILLRVALKLFLIFVLLLLLALGGSYLILGEERTERALEEGLEQVQPRPDADADPATGPDAAGASNPDADAPKTPR